MKRIMFSSISFESDSELELEKFKRLLASVDLNVIEMKKLDTQDHSYQVVVEGTEKNVNSFMTSYEKIINKSCEDKETCVESLANSFVSSLFTQPSSLF